MKYQTNVGQEAAQQAKQILFNSLVVHGTISATQVDDAVDKIIEAVMAEVRAHVGFVINTHKDDYHASDV